ncbi:MAG: hypothetical protein HC927_02555 [Deltaproteobacteria bacterium]|nr:hypothetical protein [Deltaproteobacteria bacterium]
MPSTTTFLKLALLLPFCATALACGSDSTNADDEAGETTAAEGTDSESESEDESTTTTDPTTSTSEDGSFIPDDESSSGETATMSGNLGDMCASDADCMEELFCNGVPMLGFAVCSECGSDSDCDGGNCTLSTNGYFECGDGSAGQMCETDMACGDGLYCAEVVNLGGLFNGNFCSECEDDSHCENGQLCSPMIEFMDLMNIGGEKTCVDPGTVPDGQLCDADGNGDEACMGHCTTASLMGLIEVGVCGECETDADCMGGTCMEATIGFDGFAGSTCG